LKHIHSLQTIQTHTQDYRYKQYIVKHNSMISMFHRAFFNSIIDEYQHMHFFTFNTVLV